LVGRKTSEVVENAEELSFGEGHVFSARMRIVAASLAAKEGGSSAADYAVATLQFYARSLTRIERNVG
jgi:hypothetical protein